MKLRDIVNENRRVKKQHQLFPSSWDSERGFDRYHRRVVAYSQ
jgi:hypothetical protein